MFGFIADLHCSDKSHKGRNNPVLNRDSLRAFSDACKIFSDHPGDGDDKVLVLAGDIFDVKDVSGPVVEHVCKEIERLGEQGIAVLVINGNHDPHTTAYLCNDSLRYPAIAFDGQLLQVGAVTLYGLDYDLPHNLRRKIGAAPPCDILVLHTPMAELHAFAGDISVYETPKHCTNVVVGDIHTRVNIPLSDRAGVLCSPGSLFAQSINETHAKGVALFSTVSGNTEFTFLPIPHRRIERLRVETDADLQKAIEVVMQARGENLPAEYCTIVEIAHKAEYTEQVDALQGGGCFIFTSPMREADERIEAVTELIGERGLNLSVPDVAEQLLEGCPDRVKAIVRLALSDEQAFKAEVERQIQTEK